MPRKIASLYQTQDRPHYDFSHKTANSFKVVCLSDAAVYEILHTDIFRVNTHHSVLTILNLLITFSANAHVISPHKYLKCSRVNLQ